MVPHVQICGEGCAGKSGLKETGGAWGGRVPGKRRWVSSSELSTKIINKQSIKRIEKSLFEPK